MIRYFSTVLLLLWALMPLSGQPQPVHWHFDLEPLGHDEYNLIFKATIDEGWAVYSQHIEGEGPVPTSFTFEDGAHYARIGQVEESGHKKSGFDKVFKIDITKYLDHAVFKQRVKVKDYGKPIQGYLTFMTCDDRTCLPPTDVDFSFSPKPVKAVETPPGKTPMPGPAEPKSGTGKADTKGPKAPETKPVPSPGTSAAGSSTAKGTSKSSVRPAKKPAAKAKVPSAPAPTENTKASAGGENPTAAKAAVNSPSEKMPVVWTWEVKKLGDREYQVTYHAKILKNWSLYSQTMERDDGPLPTRFVYETNARAEGLARESENLRTKYDKVFGMKVGKFHDYATFVQRIRVDDPGKPVTGYIDFMTCDDSKCMNPQKDFVLSLGDGAATVVDAAAKSKYFKGYFDSKRDIDTSNPLSTCGGASESKDKSLWLVFLLGLAGGLFALLTPCVFPMIPLTVSFFTKGGKDRAEGVRKAILYGISIIVIYVGMGTILTSLFGPTVLNDMATNVYMNVLFFVLFVIFAISFFGAFEITLPSSWANRADRASDKGGMIGIFFMAFTLAIVSFSCTGPIIGSLLVQSATGAGEALFGRIPLKPLVGMFGFSLALALPFTLFAMFPAWLTNLPKSGSWMNHVKVTLGFLELALALKFLSTADMVMHWGILKFELFMALWILIFLGLALYHFGIIRFKGDGKGRPGWFRLGIGLLSLLFAGYMIKGLVTYKSMSLLSGLAPPVHYNYFRPMDCPYNLNCFKDFDEALAYAKKVNKPLFVDFTGYGCVNCRKMEENVWNQPEILKLLSDDYVVVSLYVDDKKRLFDNKLEYLLDRGTGQKLRTVGSKWASFQVNNFNRSSQPYYVLMDNDGKTLLNNPVPYTPDVKAYHEFLACGLEAFKNKKKLLSKE